MRLLRLRGLIKKNHYPDKSAKIPKNLRHLRAKNRSFRSRGFSFSCRRIDNIPRITVEIKEIRRRSFKQSDKFVQFVIDN
jgi:hypothetical protein